jgi:hypothetical protein
MPLEPVLIVTGFVLLYPSKQSTEHLILFLRGRVLGGFPRPLIAMSYAGFHTRIKEPEFCAVREGSLHQVAVAAFNNPFLV